MSNLERSRTFFPRLLTMFRYKEIFKFVDVSCLSFHFLGRLRQDDPEFETSLDYVVRHISKNLVDLWTCADKNESIFSWFIFFFIDQSVGWLSY